MVREIDPDVPNAVAHLALLAETKHFIYFYIGTLALLLWKS
jgi:hypothetical protein